MTEEAGREDFGIDLDPEWQAPLIVCRLFGCPDPYVCRTHNMTEAARLTREHSKEYH